MHALVYIRRHKEFNAAVTTFAKKQLKATRVTSVSEYFNGTIRIDMNKKKWDYDAKVQAYIDENFDIPDIIFRDRVLRNKPFKECLVLLRRATGNILDVFSNNSFDALVTYPVDNYIVDILVQVAQEKCVPFYGVCNFFYSGYKRLTVYGEHNRYRTPSSLEVDTVMNKLQHDFHSYMAPTRKKAFIVALRRYLKYKGRYVLLYLCFAKILGRREYDYWSLPYSAEIRSLSNFFVEKYFLPMEEIDFKSKAILVPLHYFPEATIDYWSGDSSKVEFEDMLRLKIDELSERYDTIILKEHPAALFNNPASFYKGLLRNSKVVFIDPFIATSKLMQYIDIVGCWTGTVGVEALVNGKRVELFLDDQYYSQALKYHPEIIEKHQNGITIKEPRKLIAEILKGTVEF